MELKFHGPVAGTQHDGRQVPIKKYYDQLQDGGDISVLAVALMRDPSNQYDSNAIRVCVGEDEVGFIPRALAADIAPLLDEDKVVPISIYDIKENPYKPERLDFIVEIGPMEVEIKFDNEILTALAWEKQTGLMGSHPGPFTS